MRTVYIGQFDTLPVLTDTIYDSDGKTLVDLTGKTVVLSMQKADRSGPFLGGAGAVVGNPTLAKVQYQFVPADVLLAGHYLAEWIVIDSQGHQLTRPAREYIRIFIKQRLNPVAPGSSMSTISLVDIAALGALATTNLVSGDQAWVEAAHDYFVFEKTGTTFTDDGVAIIDGTSGGQWFREGFTLPVESDPSAGPGLTLPFGFRVRKADSTAAWDKTGPGDTDWVLVGLGRDPTARAAATAAQSTADAAATAAAAAQAAADSAENDAASGIQSLDETKAIGPLLVPGQLPDADVTIFVAPNGSPADITHGTQHYAGPMSADRTFTISTVAALPGEILQARLNQNSISGGGGPHHNITFVNGGGGGGTLFVFLTTDQCDRLVVFRLNDAGSDWLLDRVMRIA